MTGREEFAAARERMAREDIAARGVRDPRVLAAMRKVPRERFLSPGRGTTLLRPAQRSLASQSRGDEGRETSPLLAPSSATSEEAYGDRPQPIGCQQTISQPYIVALMTEMLGLRGKEKVLEIGTGSGYQTAILAELAAEVLSVERFAELSEAAEVRLAELAYANVRLRVGDGTLGWPEEAPFDAILVTAAAPRIPESLKAQLAEGGRMVLPVGGGFGQELVTVRRSGGRFSEEPGIAVVFVPLIGREGY
jgi:protein-L-isoaspartate(D-aspartate) O-methyltransferase